MKVGVVRHYYKFPLFQILGLPLLMPSLQDLFTLIGLYSCKVSLGGRSSLEQCWCTKHIENYHLQGLVTKYFASIKSNNGAMDE